MKKPTPFGKYYLLERINVGGMAEVFRAKAFGVEGFERLVAVKRILPNIAEDKEFIRMFIDEAKLAVQLNHANIAQIFDLGMVDASYYIALEHVHGRDLRAMFDRCRQLGEPMPTSQACFVVMKVCEGLDYAHNKRDAGGRELHLVHRDVSPQNILVSFEGEVKIIDFGIAKAAGKGSKTQAGILKGKFGYMSPEQVRGIPIDRRSDVFSCGIVLYELLTGERLFVGESDFSTLEKVRNVEILPPSTYNRRIPDELERIVLKALAKDPEERYQNAIDLHDELQAFVYTAGEFYSRKDLAGWMKKTFGREIEEESAKLESYRQLKPPPELAPQPAASGARASGTRPPTQTASQTNPIRKSTQSISRPPPPPGVRISQQMAAVAPPAPAAAAGRGGNELAWDDDELDTKIYDSPEDDPRRRPPAPSKPGLPLAAPPAQAAGSPQPAPPPVPPPAQAGSGPDLSSLVQTGRGWGEHGGPSASGRMAPASSAPPPTNGANGTNGQPAMLRTGPTRAASPPLDPLAHLAMAPTAPAVPREISAPVRLVAEPQPFASAGSFGSGMLAQKQRRSNNLLFLAVGGAVLAVLAVVVVIAMTGHKHGTPAAAAPAATAADPHTGFDLYVSPPGTLTWRLDGAARTDKFPAAIRGITPGVHQVAIDAPPGFMSENQQVTVVAGQAPKIDIALAPLKITGTFESTPSGAKVSLIVDGERQELGPTPASSPLDPRKTYQVLFEKDGFVAVNKPIVFSDKLDVKVSVDLEKASPTAAATPVTPVTPPPSHPVVDHASHGGGPVSHPDTQVASHTPLLPPPHHDTPKHDTEPKVDTTPPKPAGNGFLRIGSKPPCEILVDGSDTGLPTPQLHMKLPAGKHRIELKGDYGIDETFTVDIQADQTTTQIKDYSAKIPK